MEFPSDFARDVSLLLLTAVLIPIVLKLVDDRKHRDQQRFQADLTRQGKVIDSQVALLENLASMLWEFQLRAIEVMYYHQPGTGRMDLYENAVKEYEESSGALLGKIRGEISKLLRLAPPETYQAFMKLYYEELLGLDLALVLKIRRQEEGPELLYDDERVNLGSGATSLSWSDLQKYALHDLAEKVDEAIEHLARDLDLSWKPTTVPQRRATPDQEPVTVSRGHARSDHRAASPHHK